ncbi:biopolymer transport protein ExbD [Chitinivorax tropicus]|uniref:Biopolymer transport protein ExbD n=1 Tax=Chitinivorax tropicus TaxID=714531 RepID=A0A840MVM2_9PROT|nr:biopolymer transporter ExbD [Chitinivorax tropicus]MBB5019221.1 biopolymer transport protein ExbD [Chitinivorax tropicus]
MAFGSFDDGNAAPMAEINTTPLVDVMLVLLVVFIITAPMLTNAVNVQLPKASASQHKDLPESIRLAIDAKGGYYWNDQSVAADQLGPRFAAAIAVNPKVELHIRADESVRYDSVAKAMAAAQQQGVGKIGFVTEVPAQP